eukprot:7312590-Karenia_brevis.AAC.1
MFCATLAGNRAACQQTKRVHRQSEASRSDLNAVRANLARLFGACCRGSAEGFVICAVAGNKNTTTESYLKTA